MDPGPKDRVVDEHAVHHPLDQAGMTKTLAGEDRIGFPDVGEIFAGRLTRPAARHRAKPFADFVGRRIHRLAFGDRWHLVIGKLGCGEAEVERARGALAQSVADIAQADATLAKTRQDVERLEPLVKEEAAPKQDLDNAVAARQAAEAAVTARRATADANRAILRTAELNLEYATIRAPISGRIGDSLLQVGGLVTKTSPQPLTTIVPLDPVWVRFQVSEAELPLFEPDRM